MTDTYKQYKHDFKYIHSQAKTARYPAVKVSAQVALAHEALKAGHYDKSLKWHKRAQETLKNAGMGEAFYLSELKKALQIA